MAMRLVLLYRLRERQGGCIFTVYETSWMMYKQNLEFEYRTGVTKERSLKLEFKYLVMEGGK